MRVWSCKEGVGAVGCRVNTLKNQLEFSGDLGAVTQVFAGSDVVFGEDKLLIKCKSSYGYVISRIKSLLSGVSEGYYLELELVGRGYRFIELGNNLIVKLGSLYGLQYKKPAGVVFFVSRSKMAIFGIDLEEVNRVGNVIRGLKRPDVYKGKGIRKVGEVIRLKVGKK